MMMMYIWWWGCIPYDDDAFPMTMMHTYDDNACDNDVHCEVDALLYNMLYMHTIVWWCSPMHYDVYLMFMKYTRYTVRWWWCIVDYEDTYPMTMMHTYHDDAWQCMPHVQWKHNRITCSIIVYDEVYNDVHEQCMAVKWLLGIHGLFDSDQSVDVINNSFRVWFDRLTGSTIFFYMGGRTGKGKEVVVSF